MKNKTRKTSARVGLHVVVKNDGAYFHVGLYPVLIGLSPYEMAQIDAGRDIGKPSSYDRVRNISCRYESDTVNGLDFDGLRIWSQGDERSANDGSREPLYGWQVAYSDMFGTVDKDKAVRMARTLTAIDKRIEKLRETQGRPKTFGQYVAHVAKAIGATQLVTVSDKAPSSFDWNSVEKRFTAFPDAIDTIDHLVTRTVDARKKVAV